jgi:hypothetical protein
LSLKEEEKDKTEEKKVNKKSDDLTLKLQEKSSDIK